MSSALSSDAAPPLESELRPAKPVATNISLVEERTASEEVRTSLANYRERFSRPDVPGILLCFATNAALLNGMLQVAEGFLFGESLLSRRHKEMIATYVSQQNACPYCTASHAALLALHAVPPDMVCALQNGSLNSELFTEAEIALLTFAGKVNAASSLVNRSDVEAAISADWTEAQVAEAVHIAALFAAFNRIANAFGLPSPYPQGSRDQL